MQRVPWPGRALLPRLALVAGGVVIGFPLFSAWALRYVPAAHAAVVIGLLPLATAVAGALIAHERPSRAVLGVRRRSAASSWSPSRSGAAAARRIRPMACWSCRSSPPPIGYAEGARLARTMGGWQVICWALVIAAPVVAVPTALSVDARVLAAPAAAWVGFAYVSVVSMFLGFFAWYGDSRRAASPPSARCSSSSRS